MLALFITGFVSWGYNGSSSATGYGFLLWNGGDTAYSSGGNGAPKLYNVPAVSSYTTSSVTITFTYNTSGTVQNLGALNDNGRTYRYFIIGY